MIVCTVCNKDVADLYGVKTPKKNVKCPNCWEVGDLVFKEDRLSVFSSSQESMNALYPSCKSPKETLGKLADKNTKNMGSYAQELNILKKEQRKAAIDKIMEKTGKKPLSKKSNKRPFYRPDRDTPITHDEANKICKELNIDTNSYIKSSKTPKHVIKVKRGNNTAVV